MTKRVIGAKRLRKLAAYLDTIPPDRFDYEMWVGYDWQGDPGLSCGTTACALGWAATMPEFRALGLNLKRSRYTSVVGVVVYEFKEEGDTYSHAHENIYAACHFFYLTYTEASFLFIPGRELYDESSRDWLEEPRHVAPNSDATAQEVANHIRKYLDNRHRWFPSKETTKMAIEEGVL